jgi:hypothetical protein
MVECIQKLYNFTFRSDINALVYPRKFVFQKNFETPTLLDLIAPSLQYLPLIFLNKLNFNLKKSENLFSFSNLAKILIKIGTPNCWLLKDSSLWSLHNHYNVQMFHTQFFFYIPFFSIKFCVKRLFRKSSKLFLPEKQRSNIKNPSFIMKVPTYICPINYLELAVTAQLVAIFIKKKLEQEHLLSEVLRNINLLLKKNFNIKGFLFLLKGRFSRRERASKIWIKKGPLPHTLIWKPMDYAKIPLSLKYGKACVRVWLFVEPKIDKYSSLI